MPDRYVENQFSALGAVHEAGNLTLNALASFVMDYKMRKFNDFD